MYFAEFVQRLNGVLNVEGGRGGFAETVLKMVVTKEKKLQYSDSSYNKFYDGKTEGRTPNRVIVGDNITTCAKIIKSYLDARKFTNYLKGFCLGDAPVNELCTLFKSEIPDINCDNYAEKIAQLLIQNISDAAVDGGNTHKASDPSKPVADSKADCVTVNCKVIQRVIEILEDISALYGKLDKIALEQYERLMSKMDKAHFLLELFGEFQADEKAQNEHEQMKLREEFDTKNANLELYQKSVPEVKSEIEEIVSISKCLRFRYFPYYLSGYETVGCEYVSAKGEHEASGYKDRLQELMRKLTEMENDS